MRDPQVISKAALGQATLLTLGLEASGADLDFHGVILYEVKPMPGLAVSWRAAWPPLAVLAIAVLGILAVLVLPGPSRLDQARATALGVLLSAALADVAFMLQIWQSRRTQRQAVLRAAYRQLIAATQTILELVRELKAYPQGHLDVGTVIAGGDPFERANAMNDEWRRLYMEAERDLLLEVDTDDEIFSKWQSVRAGFWEWRDAHNLDREGQESIRLEAELTQHIKALVALCRTRLQALA